MLNTNKLLEVSLNYDSYTIAEFHQFILDVMYRQWNMPDTTPYYFSYSDMIGWMKVEYGPAAALFVLLGKFNQQVENGGHSQYLFNGYAGSPFRNNKRGEFPDLHLHKQMIDLMDRTGLSQCDLGKEVYRIMREFKVASTSYDGNSENEEMDKLDDRYYDLHDKWMAFLNNYVGEWLQTGKNPLAKQLVGGGSAA